jgi:hypothetical protein
MSSNGTNGNAHAANGSVGTIDFETGTINGDSNGHANGHTNGHANGDAAHVETADGTTNNHSTAPEAGKYTKIPGPLGIESASLKGKVALVTGAGTSFPIFSI